MSSADDVIQKALDELDEKTKATLQKQQALEKLTNNIDVPEVLNMINAEINHVDSMLEITDQKYKKLQNTLDVLYNKYKYTPPNLHDTQTDDITTSTPPPPRKYGQRTIRTTGTTHKLHSMH
jgi:Arc/MetJ-type ribon-helix-helix transcriptional regulator